MMGRKVEQITERIELFRSGEPVSSYLGSFSGSLKETRLTAALGYLISRCSKPFLNLFEIDGPISSVFVENYQGVDRTDVEIAAKGKRYIVEAKVGMTDPAKQARKYRASKRILLTQYIPRSSQKGKKRTQYVLWSDLATVLGEVAQQKRNDTKTFTNDLLAYMREHDLIDRKPLPEIYAREINSEETLSLFLKARIYSCDFEKHSRLAKTLYFAPHFGKRIARKHPGIERGISYVARIEEVAVIDNWKDFLEEIRRRKGKVFSRKNLEYMAFVKKWSWKNHRRNIVFLGEPRLVFNPPVKKENLQAGRGWLSKNYLTFDALFKAWNANK